MAVFVHFLISASILFAQDMDSPRQVSLPKMLSNTNPQNSVQLVLGIESGINKTEYNNYINQKYQANLEKRRIPGSKKETSSNNTIDHGGYTTTHNTFGSNGYTTTYEDPDLYFSPTEGDIVKQADGELYYCLQGGDKIYKFKIVPLFFEGALYQITLKYEYLIKSSNAKDIVYKLNQGFSGKGYSAKESGENDVTVFVKNNLRVTVTYKNEGILGNSVFIEYADIKMTDKKIIADQKLKDEESALQKEIDSKKEQHKTNSSQSVFNDLF